jgi:hypothetical protein
MFVNPRNERTRIFLKRILKEIEDLDPLKPKYEGATITALGNRFFQNRT